MVSSKEDFVRLATKLVAGAIKEVHRAHGEILPGSVAKRVASQLWTSTSLKSHASAAAWVRYVRGSLGYSQTRFAQALGTSQITVARWESGATSPSPYYSREIEALARRAVETGSVEAHRLELTGK